MDLRLQDQSVWLLLGQSPVAWRLAETCLEEGAWVALLCGDARNDLPKRHAALARRFGLRLRVACDERPSLLASSQADLLRWGGRPSAIVALCTHATAESNLGCDWIEFLMSSAPTLRPGGGLVLVEPDWPSGHDNEGAGAVSLAALEEKRFLWQSVAPTEARVSFVGVANEFSRQFSSGAPSISEDALVNLIIFLAGRGFGSVAAVASDGAVQLR